MTPTTPLVTSLSSTPPSPVAPPSEATAALPPITPPAPAAAPVAPVAAPAATAAQPAAPVAPAASYDGVAPPFRFVWRRLTTIDQVTAASSAVLMVALFLPWFGISSFTVNGINDHEYLAFAFLVATVLTVYLVARAGWDRLPIRMPIAHAPFLLVCGVLQLVIVVIAFLSEPTGTSRQFGAWLSIAGALGACLPIAIPAVRSFQSTR